MSLPVSLGFWIVAFIPIGMLLFLMIKVQLPAFRAAPISLAIAIFVGVFFYKSEANLIINELLKALWNSLSIILVIITALLIYEVTNEAKAFSSIKKNLEEIAPNELVRILGLGMVFVSFLQGVTGFGVPVAVTAPLLIEMGVLPLWAVVIPLIGHSWAGTYGTLAVAWSSLVTQTGIEGNILNQSGFYAGMFLWIINILSGLSICWFYGKDKGVKKGLFAVLIFSFIQGGGQLLLTQVNGIIANFLPGCIALLGFIVVNKIPMYKESWNIDKSQIMNRNKSQVFSKASLDIKLYESFFPYIVMTILTLVLLINPRIKGVLTNFSIGPNFPRTSTEYGFVNSQIIKYAPFAPLVHPSTFLLISALAGYIFYFKKGYIERGKLNSIFKEVVKKTIPSSIAIISLTMMSKVMSGTGQIDVLAIGASNILGKKYGFIAPFIGLVGSFITSSNMSSNILFSNFQFTTAELLSLHQGVILGAQTGGAAIGTAIAPNNIVLGATTSNILGEEGKILKAILPFVLGIILCFGIITYFLAAYMSL